MVYEQYATAEVKKKAEEEPTLELLAQSMVDSDMQVPCSLL